jgi:hypothetical protein
MLPNTLIVDKNMSGFTMPLNERNGDDIGHYFSDVKRVTPR